MRVRILKDDAAVSRAVADRVVSLVANRPDAVLGLPTGRTPIGLYADLRARYARGRVDFSRVRTFNLDEFLGLPPSHPASYRAFMETHLFRHVNLSKRNIEFLDGGAANADQECSRYERAIAKAGGLDLVILGIGGNGHIGFNEPAAALVADTHRARLAPATRRSNAEMFEGRPGRVPASGPVDGRRHAAPQSIDCACRDGRGESGSYSRGVSRAGDAARAGVVPQLHGDVELVLDRPLAEGCRRADGQGCGCGWVSNSAAATRCPRRARRATDRRPCGS